MLDIILLSLKSLDYSEKSTHEASMTVEPTTLVNAEGNALLWIYGSNKNKFKLLSGNWKTCDPPISAQIGT